VRVIAVGLLVRDGSVLLESYPANARHGEFLRAPGGGISFGEPAALHQLAGVRVHGAAVARQMRRQGAQRQRERLGRLLIAVQGEREERLRGGWGRSMPPSRCTAPPSRTV
jgi:hypothetical protein